VFTTLAKQKNMLYLLYYKKDAFKLVLILVYLQYS